MQTWPGPVPRSRPYIVVLLFREPRSFVCPFVHVRACRAVAGITVPCCSRNHVVKVWTLRALPCLEQRTLRALPCLEQRPLPWSYFLPAE